MSEIEVLLSDASTKLSIDMRKLPTEDAIVVRQQAQARFVTGNPRVWWLGLRQPCAEYDSSTTPLRDVLPVRAGPVFLIPETDEAPLVYEIDASNLDAVLKDCPYFEYNVVDPGLRWLVAESEHDVLYVCQHSGDDR